MGALLGATVGLIAAFVGNRGMPTVEVGFGGGLSVGIFWALVMTLIAWRDA